MKEKRIAHLLDMIDHHADAFARIPLSHLQDAGETAVLLISSVLGYQVVLLLIEDGIKGPELLASKGIDSDDLSAWTTREALVRHLCGVIDHPSILECNSLDEASAGCAHRLGLGEIFLAVPLKGYPQNGEDRVGLVVAAQPHHDYDPNVDIMAVEIIAGVVSGGISKCIAATKLFEIHEAMNTEIKRRKRAEQALRRVLNGLEMVIEEQAVMAVEGYKKLKREIEERMEAEEALRRTHNELEERTAELVKANERLKREIEERQMVEEALRESEKKYKTLVESSLTGIFIHQDGRYVFVNDRFAEIHSYTSEELLGKEYLTLLHPDERDALAQIASARLKGEDVPQRYEVRRLAKNGKTIWCEMMATNIEYGGRPAIMGNVIDISQRKRAEEALQRSQRELRRLSSQLINVQEDEKKRISWELHDSIGQVLASVKIGLGNAIGKIRQGMAGASVESLEALMSVVQQAIKEVRRIYTDLRPSLLDDLGIISSIFWFCREFENVHLGIRIEKQIDLEEKEVPEALKIVIFRVLQEALNNVSKYAKADLVRLSIRKTNSKIELIIEDNGQGFDVEHVRSANKAMEGVGLGSMKERTQLSGGTFLIDSTKGEGTTVRASWPRKQ